MQPYLNERAPKPISMRAAGICIAPFMQTVDPSNYLLLDIFRTPPVTLWFTYSLGVWSHLGSNDVVKNERDSSDRGDIGFLFM